MNGLKNESEELVMSDYFISVKLRRGVTIETIHEWSEIDLFFLQKLKKSFNLKKN